VALAVGAGVEATGAVEGDPAQPAANNVTAGPVRTRFCGALFAPPNLYPQIHAPAAM